ncbi:MAG: AN1-type zinc finger protein [Methanocellales archaeon]
MVATCNYCGREFHASLISICDYCLGNFCPDHRLPPNHSCIKIEFWDFYPPSTGSLKL